MFFVQNITITLDAFEGPFDLLYHLIEKNEIDIYDIPIALITEQYLEYLQEAQNKNMDGMSEFLVMAATLLEIKSKLLLPLPVKEEEETDPREELVSKLLEYKKFKNITNELKIRQEQASFFLYKEAKEDFQNFYEEDEPSIDEFLQGITLKDIFHAFEEVMRRKEAKIDRVRSSFNAVERDLYTIGEKIEYIKDLLILHPKVKFNEIFRDNSKKMEIVVTFLALLELIKQKQVIAVQETAFDEILIKKYEREQNENYRTGSNH